MHSDTFTESSASNLKLSEGQQVGGCFLLKKALSQSRTETIWLAQDEVLGKEITLHFVPPAVLKDARAVAELRQEVKWNRQLIHPNILRVYDLVEDGDLLAVAMDRFEGESLRDRLASKGPVSPDEMSAWAAQLAEIVGDAHRIQLFHRDLSPENIYVRPNGTLFVTNFGLSRVICEALERAGQIKGNEAHLASMSPQQMDGDRAGASDDVYGLGALVYEALTGKPPFEGENLVSAIRKNTPPPVNEVRSAANLPPVSAGWEKMVAACLEKSPEQRPKTCAEAVALVRDSKETIAPAVAVAPVIKSVPEPVAAEVLAEPKVTSELEVKPPEPPKSAVSSAPAKAPATVGAQLPPIPPASNKPKPSSTPLSANFPDLDRPKSKLPLIGLGLAASVLAAALYFRGEGDPNTGIGGAVSRVDESAPAFTGDRGMEPLPLPGAVEGDSEDGVPLIVSTASESSEEPKDDLPSAAADGPLIAAADTAKPPKGSNLIGANPGAPKDAAPGAKPAPAPAQAPTEGTNPEAAPRPAAKSALAPIPLPPAPEPLPKVAIPQNAKPDQLAQLLADREAALAKFEEAAAAAERVQQANTQLREIRQEDLDEQKKTLEAKRKTLSPVLKEAAEFEAERKKLEEAMAKTEEAAREAAKAAETAKRSYEEMLANSGEKIAAKEKAEAELASVTEAVTEGTKQLEGFTEGASKADAQRQQMLAAKKQLDQEIQQLTLALEKSTKAQRDAMVKANRPKITAIEQQIKELDEQMDRYSKAVASLEALNDDSTKDALARIQEKITAAKAQKAAHEEEIKVLSGMAKPTAPAASVPATQPPAPTPPKPAATPAGAAVEAPKLPQATAPMPEATPAAPPKEVAVATAPSPAPAATSDPATEQPKTESGANSLGMRFVPVGDVQFAVHLVTRKDFEAFSKATNLKPEHWRNPGFEQTPEHPVVNVTWKEAEAFCKWLTDKERKSGGLKSNELYRLPSDLEWSKAVGLPVETEPTPEERDMRIEDVYPWGSQWPPPPGAGNFAGEETVTELPIEGYNDKFPNTSPVGSFKPNALGLYDMGGNVWQWVLDSFDGSGSAKTLRGGSWYNGAIKMSLLSSCRIKSSPETINDTYGFRIVKATETKKR